MNTKEKTDNIIHMKKDENGIFVCNGSISSTTERNAGEYLNEHKNTETQEHAPSSSEPHTHANHYQQNDNIASFWHQEQDSNGNSSVAENLRMANENYISSVRQRFEESRQQVMAQMAAMTSYQNIRN